MKNQRVFSQSITLTIIIAMFSILSASAATSPLHFIHARYDNIGLTEATSVAVSPDGKHVYVTGSEEDAVAVFARDGLNGSLIPVEVIRDGVGPVDGLNQAWGVTVSPDGHHVYVAARGEDTLVAFSRNSTTGVLTYLEREKEGEGLVDGIEGAAGVFVSPDGKHVYVAGWGDDAVAWFTRNLTTGYLTYGDCIKDTDVGVDGLYGVWSVVVSPDGNHLYAAAGSDDAVAVFSRNNSTGALTYIERKKDGEFPVDGLDVALSIAISPNGSHVYVVGRNDNAVAVFSRNASTGRLTFLEMEQDGAGGVSGMSSPHSVFVSFDGKHVYIATLSSAVCFTRNTSTGYLIYASKISYTDPGVLGLFGGYGIAASPDNNNLYVAARDDHAIVAFSRNLTTGALSFVHTIEGIDGLDGPVGIAVSADGKYLYATGNDDDAVAVISLNPASGAMVSSFYKQEDGVLTTDGLDGARSIVISPDGKHVYVAGNEDDAVAAFTRNSTTGSLGFVEVEKDNVVPVDGLDGAQDVTISPDGKHVYVASQVDNAVAVFSRNFTTGELTYVENEKDGAGGVTGLNGAYAVAVSPDGKHVYVVGYEDDAVVLFLRNSTSGALTHDWTYQQGTGGVLGMVGANDVVVSPDGAHVYVASRTDDAVVLFWRNSSNGRLLYWTDYQDTDPGLDGLNGARALAMSPDGDYLYVASQYDDAVAVFSRDASSGFLTYLGRVKDNQDGVDGLDTANGIAVSSNGFYVYASGYGDDAVAAFATNSLFLPTVKKN